jgi:hypothetical protein
VPEEQRIRPVSGGDKVLFGLIMRSLSLFSTP